MKKNTKGRGGNEKKKKEKQRVYLGKDKIVHRMLHLNTILKLR